MYENTNTGEQRTVTIAAHTLAYTRMRKCATLRLISQDPFASGRTR